MHAGQARLDSEFVIRAPETASIAARPLPPSAYASIEALKCAIGELDLPPLPRTGGGRKLSLELNYRSRQPILDVAYGLLAPSYANDPAAQLRLLSSETAASLADTAASAASSASLGASSAVMAGGAAGEEAASATAARIEFPPDDDDGEEEEEDDDDANRGSPRLATDDAVLVVAADDAEHEAEFVVDQILRLRDRPATLAPPPAGAASGYAEPPSIAILYRTNAQSMAFERRLVREGVPYVLAAQRSFYARKEIRDALSYLRLLRSNDTLSLERIINVPPRKIGATTLATLHAAAAARRVSRARPSAALFELLLFASDSSAERHLLSPSPSAERDR